MTKTGEARECGEFWFLVPPANSSLDKRDKDHRVLLLVDKEEYDTKSEVIVYVPTSHVLLHQVLDNTSMLETLFLSRQIFSASSCCMMLETRALVEAHILERYSSCRLFTLSPQNFHHINK